MVPVQNFSLMLIHVSFSVFKGLLSCMFTYNYNHNNKRLNKLKECKKLFCIV